MTTTGLHLPPDTCPVCGFAPRRLFPHEAVRTIRTLKRRWREGLGLVAAHEEGEAFIRTPLGAGPSALGHALLVAAAFDRAAEELHLIRSSERPQLDDVTSSTPIFSDELSTGLVLDILSADADRLVAEAERFHGHDWLRTGSRSTREVSALEALRRAVHEATHRLEETTRGLTRLHPAEPDAA